MTKAIICSCAANTYTRENAAAAESGGIDSRKDEKLNMDGLAYIKIFLDWPESTQMLKDSEKGRLIDALVAYARGDEDAGSRLAGNERYVFPMFRSGISRDIAKFEEDAARKAKWSQARQNAGKAGGLAKASNRKQNLANSSKSWQTVAKPSNKEEEKEKEEDKEKDKEKEEGLKFKTDSSISHNQNNKMMMNNREEQPTRAREESESNIIHHHLESGFQEVLELYANQIQGGYLPSSVVTELQEFTEALGAGVVKHGIEAGIAENKRAWSYIRAILRSYKANGLTTLSAVLEEEQKFAERKKRGKDGISRGGGGMADKDYTTKGSFLDAGD